MQFGFSGRNCCCGLLIISFTGLNCSVSLMPDVVLGASGKIEMVSADGGVQEFHVMSDKSGKAGAA